MLIKSIHMRSFLSFGPDSQIIQLGPLNVVVGPNGTGKSNLLDGFALLRAACGGMTQLVRDGGGVREWMWKGREHGGTASVEAVVETGCSKVPSLRYRIGFVDSGGRFEIVDEQIERAEPSTDMGDTSVFYHYENGQPFLTLRPADGQTQIRSLPLEKVNPQESILTQRRDPENYPEMAMLAEALSAIRIYGDWTLGRFAPPRIPQPADLPNHWLEWNARNLGLVLNRLRRNPATKAELVKMFQAIYEEAQDFDVIVEGGTVQVFVQENGFSVPATRLSDGTLRYLCLLAVLLDPAPPRLICIDEPELGLHPDLIGNVADALRVASERTQVVVTTHSPTLVDNFTDDPDSVLVCEKDKGSTCVRRLNSQHLAPWLEKYRLGELWSSGEIGGNRW